MGLTFSEESQETLLSRLQFVHTLQDEHFGRIDILKFKQPPYEYLMKYTRVFREQDEQFRSELQFLQQLRQKSHKNLVKIHQIESKEEKQMCIIHVKIEIYCNYYNFTLGRAVQKKKANGLRFAESELWYVLSTLVELGRYLQSEGLSLGDYRSQDIFLTPEGYYIKLYLLNLAPDNRHNAYFTVLANRQQLESHLLSPEQLGAIRKNRYQIDFDVYKSDLFSVGMLMLELIFMDDPKFNYNPDLLEVNFDRVRYNLIKLKGELSPELQNLLHHCLQEDPHLRYDFKQASAHIDRVRNRISIAGCVKLIDDEEQTDKKKEACKQSVGASGFRSLPMGVEHRLQVTPIVSYADKKSEKGESSRVSPKKNLQNESTSSSSLSYEKRVRK